MSSNESSSPRPTADASGRVVELGRALEHLLAVLDRPDAGVASLRDAWASCAEREEAVLEELRRCADAPPEEREELAALLRNVARLHGLAQQAAHRERDGAGEALRRARAVLGGLRGSRVPDVPGGSCDVAG